MTKPHITPERRAELMALGAERVAAERVAQGLPPKVEDPASYERRAILLRRPDDTGRMAS